MNKEDILRQIIGDLSGPAPKDALGKFGNVEEANAPNPAPSGGLDFVALGLQGPAVNNVLDKSAGGLTEFVGYNPLCYTSGYVIANLDPALQEYFGWDKKYRSFGLISSRFTAAPHLVAGDDAVKATNTKLLLLETPNEPQAHGARGCFMIFGAEDVSDARRVVELVLEGINRTYGGVGLGETGAYDIQWTANAGQAITDFMGGDYGKAWGFLDAVPKSLGLLMADAALKAANVKLKIIPTLEQNCYSAEFITVFTGDSGAVLQAVRRAREVAEDVLKATGTVEPFHVVDPYY